MQGRYINHQALKALGGRERISMITSFRPKSADVKDESVLTGVRGISNLNELYSDYTQYRLELLEDRFREQARQQRQRVVEGKRFDTRDVKEFLRQQKDYIETTLNELVE
jgi:stress-induced morphogen